MLGYTSGEDVSYPTFFQNIKIDTCFLAGADFCYPIMRLNFWRKWRKSAFAHSKSQAISKLLAVS